MKKDRRKHRRRRQKSPSKRSKGLRFIQHPLSRIDTNELREVLATEGQKQIEEFPKLIESIRQLFRKAYPPHILAVISNYGLQIGVTEKGAQGRLGPHTEQHHVEILQALALMVPEEDWGHLPANPEHIQSAFDLARDVTESFHWRRFAGIDAAADLQQRAALALQERVRLHTQAIRNWGYFSQVVRISKEIYAPLDESFVKALGFSASDVISVAEHLVKFVENGANERLNWLREVFRQKTVRGIINAYYDHHPTVIGDPEDLLRTGFARMSRDAILAMLLSHADLLLVDTMEQTSDRVSSITGISESAVAKALRALSYAPGELTDRNPEHLFMANPIWTKPVLALRGKYFCPLPQSIFSQIHSVMRSLAEQAQAIDLLEKRRAAYLERKTGALLAAALPLATMQDGVKWQADGTVFETDHIALIDKTLLIFEDKSATLTGPGLRGAPDRVQRHVRDLIVNPSEQSARLEKVVQRAKLGDQEAAASLAPFNFDARQIDRVLRVSITLEDFSVLSSAETVLRVANWIPPNLKLAPTMNLADLETVTDILDRPSFLLHYLWARERIQKDGPIVADELDFLGAYLRSGLNFGDLETQRISLSLSGASKSLDHYYTSLDVGVAVPKPKPKISRYFSAVIDRVEQRKFAGWTIVASDILSCATHDEQQKIVRLMEKLRRTVNRGWRDPDHSCSIVIESHALQRAAVIFFIYPPQLFDARDQRAESLAEKALHSANVDRCTILCRNTARWDEPYASILAFSK